MIQIPTKNQVAWITHPALPPCIRYRWLYATTESWHGKIHAAANNAPMTLKTVTSNCEPIVLAGCMKTTAMLDRDGSVPTAMETFGIKIRIEEM